MADTLFPVVSIPSLTTPVENTDIRYRKSAAWDLKKGDFVRDPKGVIQTDTGRDAYVVWCIKTSTTERYTCEAYPDEIGTELEEAKQQKTHAATELMIERTIREALMVNPRTEYVRGFTFIWNGDAVSVTFTVKGKDLEEFTVSI